MSKFRKSAQGRECQIRLPGYCLRNTETTVLAHLSGGGMGRKQPDIFGAYSCFACHNIVDGRHKSDLSVDERRLAHLEGVIRTQKILLDEGLIEIK